MREFILKNFWLKVFSLVLAALIWFVLQANFQTEIPQNPFRPRKVREFRCPVTLLISPSDRHLYTIEPAEVTIKINGDSSTLAEMDAEDIEAYVNLSAVRIPEGNLRVEAIVPHDVTLRSIVPAHVYVKPSS